MRVNSLQLTDFRSYKKTDQIDFDQINILIGPNNSGKTSILRALYLLQVGYLNHGDIRFGSNKAKVQIEIDLKNPHPRIATMPSAQMGYLTIEINPNKTVSYQIKSYSGGNHTGNHSFGPFGNKDPDHFIIPFHSKRKTISYSEEVNQGRSLEITGDFQYLAAKISRIADPTFPAFKAYEKACKEILGFVVTAIPSNKGHLPGAYLPNKSWLSIDQMGEGVPNIVSLLAELALSEGKLFLIEELENDLHPKAIKALLDLITISSKSNQFVISTHSNIVVRYLAAEPNSKLYYVSLANSDMPTEATIKPVEETPQARVAVLRDLGYSFSDFELWDGWLFLEESSAERIIRDYLIPWFVPKLSRVRTLATGGVDGIEPTFYDFHRMTLYTHLESVYKNAAWVRVDKGERGSEIIEQLRKCYTDWDSSRFQTYKKPQFEQYYPAKFSEESNAVLEIKDRQEKRKAKTELLEKVRTWLDEDKERGREALQQSAKEIIEDLQSIEAELFKQI